MDHNEIAFINFITGSVYVKTCQLSNQKNGLVVQLKREFFHNDFKRNRFLVMAPGGQLQIQFHKIAKRSFYYSQQSKYIKY